MDLFANNIRTRWVEEEKTWIQQFEWESFWNTARTLATGGQKWQGMNLKSGHASGAPLYANVDPPRIFLLAISTGGCIYIGRGQKKKNTHQPTDQPTNRIIPARRHGLDLWLTKRPTMEYFFKKEKKNLANKTHSKSWLVGGKTTAATNEWLERWGNANETNKHKKKEKEKSGHNSDEWDGWNGQTRRSLSTSSRHQGRYST